MKKEMILVIGSSGQVGTELVLKLRSEKGGNAIIATDIKVPGYEIAEGGPFEILDVLDMAGLSQVVQKYKVRQIYLLAALLSATSEQSPAFAWRLNVNGLMNVLELARQKIVAKVYWPSSIAVFGPNTPKINAPQFAITEPATVYGISKLAGERWCEYYFLRYGVDVRSIRYSGLMGYKSEPGGGTTDYAVNIFYEAIKKKRYSCFLKENTKLPMMYMPDAVRATLELMEADHDKVKIRSSYNVAGLSFSPGELAKEIKSHIPEFICSYKPDTRQKLAESWPKSIDDKHARTDWGWKPRYTLKQMVKDMLRNLTRFKKN